MYFDRYDITDAYYLFFTHCYNGMGCWMYKRLCKMRKYYKPSPLLNNEDDLTENGRAIYDTLVAEYMDLFENVKAETI